MNKSIEVKTPVVVLVGPTAIGKTELSFIITDKFDAEVVSMDSMQVYRYMDIGTAKPSEEEMSRVKHHLIDIVNPDEQYNAARFVKDCLSALKQIGDRGKVALVTGGTGLYLSALINGLSPEIKVKDEVRKKLRARAESTNIEKLHQELSKLDPESGNRIAKSDKQRILRGLEIFLSTGIPWSVHIAEQKKRKAPLSFANIILLGLTCDRSLLHERIELRSKNMIKSGLLEEVEGLLSMGYKENLSAMQSIGYRHACEVLKGSWTPDFMIERLAIDTRRYAKRQMTWFRNQLELDWYDRKDREGVVGRIDSFLDNTIR